MMMSQQHFYFLFWDLVLFDVIDVGLENPHLSKVGKEFKNHCRRYNCLYHNQFSPICPTETSNNISVGRPEVNRSEMWTGFPLFGQISGYYYDPPLCDFPSAFHCLWHQSGFSFHCPRTLVQPYCLHKHRASPRPVTSLSAIVPSHLKDFNAFSFFSFFFFFFLTFSQILSRKCLMCAGHENKGLDTHPKQEMRNWSK